MIGRDVSMLRISPLITAGFIRLGFIALLCAPYISGLAARDLDGHYAVQNPELHRWFDSLANQHGQLCCSIADGRTVEDPDVDDSSGHWRVRVDGEWLDVPDDAVITVPNRYGPAVVWPFKDYLTGKTIIRCFMPGAGT
jgi:hypothetical protein